jgi:cytochrome c-type biogenesis protein CcmH/NrfF
MKRVQRKNMSIWLWLLVLIMALIIGYFLGKGYRITAPTKNSSKIKTPELILTSKAIDIIKELNCVCGSCTEKLMNCTCKIYRGADEMKQFIQLRVNEGLSKSQILEKIVEKYGKGALIK